LNISDLFTKVEKLTVDETREIVDKESLDKVVLLDVREPAEYEKGHIPGAVFMPLSGLQDSLRDLDRSKKIITY
jgi:rhodanese-related sulfurtransferase